MIPKMTQWDLENLLQAAILGILLMIYADQRSYHSHSRRWRHLAHLFIVYLIGLSLIIRLLMYLLIDMR